MAEILFYAEPSKQSTPSQHAIPQSARPATQRIHSYFHLSMASSGQFENTPATARNASAAPANLHPFARALNLHLQPQQSTATSASSASFPTFQAAAHGSLIRFSGDNKRSSIPKPPSTVEFSILDTLIHESDASSIPHAAARQLRRAWPACVAGHRALQSQVRARCQRRAFLRRI
jgi:hypothetical protein